MGQIKNVQMLTATEPMMTPFMPFIDPLLVQEFIGLYDVGMSDFVLCFLSLGIRDVQEALTMNYSQVVLLKGEYVGAALSSHF